MAEQKKVDNKQHTIDIKREIWESGAMAVSIANMKRRGISKSEAVRISGVPYEIVDRMYRGDVKGEKD